MWGNSNYESEKRKRGSVKQIQNLFFFIIFSLFLTSSLLAEETLLKRTQMMMGTYVSIKLEPHDSELFSKGFDVMHNVEKALSSYNKNAIIFQLNKNREVRLEPLTFEALSLSKRYYEESSGAFNITIGSITKGLYHFGEDERIPTDSERLHARIAMDGLKFNATHASLSSGIRVDLGGMGKGFGVDKLISFLRSKGVTHAQVMASGDIHCLGVCEIAIKDPFKEGVIATFATKTTSMSISTSGNYERFVHNKKNNHLINPKTKAPAKTFASVTLVATQPNADLDAYATAASVMSYDDAIKFLEQRGVWYFLVSNDGSMSYKEPLVFIDDLVIKPK